MNSKEAYQAELARADHDHHVPTAGAMTGHILANLTIFRAKLRQARLYATGPASQFLNQTGREWASAAAEAEESLLTVLVAQGQPVPTTFDQLLAYAKLQEDGATKYLSGAEQVADLVKDLTTQLLFVGKAIGLANQEGRRGLASALVALEAQLERERLVGSRFAGVALPTPEVDDDDEW